MAMKMRKTIAVVFLSACLMFMLNACNPLGIDISDRINAFIVELNSSDRSTISSQFDPSLSATLSAFSWNTAFPVPLDADHQYAITLLDYSNPSNVTATMYGPPLFNAGTGQPLAAVFSMVKAGPDWYIESLTVGTVVVP
jgi:predicted small secreted protein